MFSNTGVLRRFASEPDHNFDFDFVRTEEKKFFMRILENNWILILLNNLDPKMIWIWILLNNLDPDPIK